MINGVREPVISNLHGTIVRNAFGKDSSDLVSGRPAPANSHTKRIEMAYTFIIEKVGKEYPSREDIDNLVPVASQKYNVKESTLYRILKTR